MSSKPDWKKIYESTSLPQVMIIKGMLDEHGIETRTINKQDSIYVQFNTFTFIELYALAEDVVKAIRLIETKNVEES